jgi:hypothetical protein
MKSILITLITIGLIGPVSPQAVTGPDHYYGAWSTEIAIDNQSYTCVKIYTPEYFIYSIYSQQDKAFKAAGGGTWETTNKGLKEFYEFNSNHPDWVGKTLEYRVLGHDEKTMITDSTTDGKSKTHTWTRLDDGKSALFGAWRITERERNGKMSAMRMGPRKTFKILSGKHFQWAAFNVETKEFFATGGGTYTITDDKYTEHIGFFSRDNSRVGASLTFAYTRNDRQWHHKGMSSKGNPIYEIWTLQDD